MALTIVTTQLNAAGGRASAGGLPNVVVIQTDDQRLDEMSTPAMRNVRELIGSQGVTFNRYYATDPVCCPSRTSLLTGRYPHNTQVLTNTAVNGIGGYPGFKAHVLNDNLAVWLQAAGYRTIHLGKFLNSYGDQDPTEVPPGWSHWATLIGERGARRFYNYRLNINGALTAQFGSYSQPSNKTYSTNVLTGLAQRQINGAVQNGQPFYLQVDYNAPHVDNRPPFGPQPAPADIHAFPHIGLPHNRSINEGDVSDKPDFVGSLPLLRRKQLRAVAAHRRRRLQALLDVDRSVAKLINALATTGQLSKTYILYTTDNGFLLGEHRFTSSKFLAYEPSAHLMMLLRGPGLPAGAHSNALIGNIDIAPTILQLTGAQPSISPDGESFLRFAQNPGQTTRRPLVLEAWSPADLLARAANGAHPQTYAGLVDEKYKFIRYASGIRELYDLRRDPYELRNLVSDSRYRRVIRWFAHQLRSYSGCAGRACRLSLPRAPRPG